MQLLKICLVLMLSLGIVFMSIPNLYADETSELILKILVKKGIITQAEVDEMRGEIRRKPVVGEKVPASVEERIAALEEKTEETGFLTAKGYKIDVKGGAEIEFVDIEEDDAGVALDSTSSADDSENPRLQVDKVTMRFTVTGEDENIGFSSELEMDEPSSGAQHTFFDDAYIFVKGIEAFDAKHSFKVGLMSRYIEPKKIFESYPLNGFVWWEDEEYMLLYKGEYDKWLYWYGEVARANEMNDKAPTENGQFEMLHDNRLTSNTAEIGNKFATGAGLGFKLDGYFGKIDLLGFFRTGDITDDDAAYLQARAGYGASETKNDYKRAGFNIDYKFGDIGLRGQYIESDDGALQRRGWHVEPYYKIKIGWKYLDSITPAIQASWLDVGLPNVNTDARTWDREKWTFGAALKINKNLEWKNEYSVNEEETGGSGVENNEFISQLKYSF